MTACEELPTNPAVAGGGQTGTTTQQADQGQKAAPKGGSGTVSGTGNEPGTVEIQMPTFEYE
ncbi:hypothetical protein D3C86_2176090 [compost metagenome]